MPDLDCLRISEAIAPQQVSNTQPQPQKHTHNCPKKIKRVVNRYIHHHPQIPHYLHVYKQAVRLKGQSHPNTHFIQFPFNLLRTLPSQFPLPLHVRDNNTISPPPSKERRTLYNLTDLPTLPCPAQSIYLTPVLFCHAFRPFALPKSTHVCVVSKNKNKNKNASPPAKLPPKERCTRIWQIANEEKRLA